jgi:hypothetical protein
VSRSAGELVTWAEACVRALDENGITATFEGPASTAVNVRTTAGAIVTGWASDKVSAGGPQILRDDALAVLASADLVVGYKRGATGGMLMRLPEPPACVTVSLADLHSPDEVAREARNAQIDAGLAKVDDALSLMEPCDVTRAARDAITALRDLAALALGREVRS